MGAKVYIVIEADYEDVFIRGVYAEERDAAAEVLRLNAEQHEWPGSTFYYDSFTVV